MQFFCIMYLSPEVSQITCRFDNALFCYNSNSNCTLHRLSALKTHNLSWYKKIKIITTFINICFYTLCGVCRVKHSKYKYSLTTKEWNNVKLNGDLILIWVLVTFRTYWGIARSGPFDKICLSKFWLVQRIQMCEEAKILVFFSLFFGGGGGWNLFF